MKTWLLAGGPRVYRYARRRVAGAWPPGTEDEAVEVFDALQRQAFDDAGWTGLARCWVAEAVALTRARHLAADPSAPPPQGGQMTTLRQDVRDAWRALRRTPGYTLIVMAMLALGIGVNIAVFSVVDALLFKALPYADADRLVLAAEWPRTGGNWTVAATSFAQWRRSAHAFTGLEARLGVNLSLLDGGDAEAVRGARVTTGYFDLLGIRPVRGRTFDHADADTAAPCVAVVSHALWTRRLGADAAAVGRPLRISGLPCTLIGVLPPDSLFDRGAPEVYIPLVFTPLEAQSEGRMLTVMGRLKDGVTLDQARTELAGIAAVFNKTRGPAGVDWTTTVLPWRDVIVRTDSRQLVWMLFGAVGLVLVIACANVAGLSLSRTISRRREIAVRAALGAGRLRVFRAFVTESVVLALAGGAVAILVGAAALRSLVALMPPGTFPAEVAPVLDWRGLVFATLASVATGVVAGVLPAWQAGRVTLTEALAAGGRAVTSSRASSWLQSALLVVELSLAMVLVTGASLLVASFVKLGDVPPGFNPSGVLTVRLSAPVAKYQTDEALAGLYAGIRRSIKAIPAVDDVGGVTSLPLGGWLFGTTFRIQGEPPPEHLPSAHEQHATPGYFDALRIHVTGGRSFTDGDDARAPRVVVVNETFARKFVPGSRAVGRIIYIGAEAPGKPDLPREIVGVVADVKTGGLADGDLATPEIYVPVAQMPLPVLLFAIRTSHGDPMALAPDVRAAVRAVDPELPVAGLMTMDERIGASLRTQRFRTLIIAAFAVLAALLACLGVYAVRSRAVAARVREMGIRVALGATGAQVVRLTLAQGMRIAAVGLGIGVVAAILLSNTISAWLFATRATDPLIIAGATVLLGAAAMMASWVPARRAARVDPLVVLREN